MNIRLHFQLDSNLDNKENNGRLNFKRVWSPTKSKNNIEINSIVRFVCSNLQCVWLINHVYIHYAAKIFSFFQLAVPTTNIINK